MDDIDHLGPDNEIFMDSLLASPSQSMTFISQGGVSPLVLKLKIIFQYCDNIVELFMSASIVGQILVETLQFASHFDHTTTFGLSNWSSCAPWLPGTQEWK